MTNIDVHYRQEIVRQVFAILRAGDSCSIVAASGMGKSNLFRFLGRVDVRQLYLGAAWSDYLFLEVDSHALTELSEQALCQALLARLMQAWKAQHGEETAIASLESRLGQGPAAWPASRSVETLAETVSLVLAGDPRRHVVIILDQFDEVYTGLPARFFLNLRSMRDEHRQQVSFVVLTRELLPRLSADARHEEFYELLGPHVIGLGPYEQQDALELLQRVGGRYGNAPDRASAEYLIDITGGHPGLLKAACMALALGQLRLPEAESERLEALLANPDIRTECSKLLKSVSAEENASLLAMATLDNPTVPQDVESSLRLKGLLVQNGDEAAHLFAPLLGEYLAAQAASTAATIRVDAATGRVQIGDHPIEGLTHLEFELLAYLYGRAGQVCSRDDIQDALYPHEREVMRKAQPAPGSDIGDASRVDAVVGRLRAKIEPKRSRPIYVVTVHGRGYKLCRADPGEAGP